MTRFFLMNELKDFIRMNPSRHVCLKYSQYWRFSFPVLACMDWFLIWLFKKTKEVGVRKVLGASVQSIVYLFSKEFTILIGIAFLIAAPVGYYLMNKWLSGFYYHTNLGWEIFLIAMIISVIIAWMTVGYKALKAAISNPVKSLRTE